MRLTTTRGGEGGQAIVLVLIVLAVLAAGYWMLISSRASREQDAHHFAREAAERLIVKQDARFLDERLAPSAYTLYPPSWRERFFALVRNLGPVGSEMEVEGTVQFTSQFFTPAAVFHARFMCATGPASVELQFSHPGVRWEIDNVYLSWTRPPAPTPTPIPVPTASPSPSPTRARRR